VAVGVAACGCRRRWFNLLRIAAFPRHLRQVRLPEAQMFLDPLRLRHRRAGANMLDIAPANRAIPVWRIDSGVSTCGAEPADEDAA
jgi:hypothetical protein